MKNQIKIMLLPATLCGIFLFGACGSKTESPDGTEVTEQRGDSGSNNYGETNDTTRTNDAMVKELTESLKEIKSSVTHNETELTGFRSRVSTVENDNSSNRLFLLIALVLSSVAIVLSLIAIWKVKLLNERASRHRGEIDRLKGDKGGMRPLGSSVNQVNFADIAALKERLRRLEEVNALRANPYAQQAHNSYQPSHWQQQAKPVAKPEPRVETHPGYFGVPAMADRGYFKTFMTMRSSEARFAAEQRGDSAEFHPLLGATGELQTLTTTDTFKLAVEFTGCAPSEARGAKVEQPGVAVLQSNRWYIQKKAIVKLSR